MPCAGLADLEPDGMSGRGSHLLGALGKASSSDVQFPHNFIYTTDARGCGTSALGKSIPKLWVQKAATILSPW